MSFIGTSTFSALRTVAFAASSAMVLATCRTAVPPRPPASPEPTAASSPDTRDLEPGELLDFVRAGEDRVHTLRARFTARVETDERDDREIDGIVIVARPDAFRMSLISPLGLSVFDHVSNGDRSRTRYPMGPPSSESAAAATPFSHEELAEAFLRGDHAYPGHCAPDVIGKDVVEFRCSANGNASYRILTVERAHGRILDERSYRDGRERLHITLGDHHVTDGVELPRRITMRWPDRDRQTDIEIHEYQINPPLDADLFDVEPPPDRR